MKKDGWADTLSIITGILVPIAVDVVRAVADGDADAYRRVAAIIPSPMASEALLAHERARLAALKGGGDDD